MKYMIQILFWVLLTAGASAQPFIEEIREFRKADSLNFPPAKANLFIGSSSIKLWTTIHDDFKGYPIINRGFGGSSLPDVIRYLDDVVYPYQPRQVIIYCGENDLAASPSVTPDTVAMRFRHLFEKIRERYPRIRIVYISIKPSPSRAHLMPKMEETNRMIREFLATEKRTKYIDVYSLMLTPDGNPRKELFVADMLHMNAEGYAIWRKKVKKVLKR